MTAYGSSYLDDLADRLPFRVRRWMWKLKFPTKLEQYLLADAYGVVDSIMRDEEADGCPIIHGENYWYFPDKQQDVVRPLIVAHVDTVCSPFPPSELVRVGGRIRNPDGILGADDRAGVYGALELRRRTGVGVLLCDEEERGAHGAKAAADMIGELIKAHPYMVELDRRGHREVVYYRSECLAFCDHVESYGFKSSFGTFSDISVLSRELNIPGANVSIGFNYQHTASEYLDLHTLWDTLRRVQKLIEENKTVAFTPVYTPKYVYFPRDRRAQGCKWSAPAKQIKGDVIDIEALTPDDALVDQEYQDYVEGRMTREQIDHMVAMDLECKGAERLAELEARDREWEEDRLTEPGSMYI